jgi:hypothetical protein
MGVELERTSVAAFSGVQEAVTENYRITPIAATKRSTSSSVLK